MTVKHSHSYMCGYHEFFLGYSKVAPSEFTPRAAAEYVKGWEAARTRNERD